MPVDCVWIATGNNPALSHELVRRTVRIQLDARMDRPWFRAEFAHPDLRAWVPEHRGQSVWAILTLVQACPAVGRLEGTCTLGNFEAWAKLLGRILQVAGIEGFLGDLSEF